MAPADAAGDPGADHGLSHLEPAASRCDWAQTIVTEGLLKVIHGRWTCLPLAFAFCLRLHTLRAGCIRVRNQLSLVRMALT